MRDMKKMGGRKTKVNKMGGRKTKVNKMGMGQKTGVMKKIYQLLKP